MRACAANPVDQGFGQEGLGKQVDGGIEHAVIRQYFFCMAGDENDLHFGADASKHVGQLLSVHAGHEHIGNQKIDFFGASTPVLQRFRTAPGFLDGGDSWRKAKEEGLAPGGGPALVISNLAVMDFEEESKAMRLVSVHPNVTVEQVKAATGFELIIPHSIPITAPPDAEEIRLLREIDDAGLLRG